MSGSANLAMIHAATLAKELDKNKVTPGVLGFLVFAALAVGVWFLMKSLNRHMGRINFEDSPAPEKSTGNGTGSGAVAGTAARPAVKSGAGAAEVTTTTTTTTAAKATKTTKAAKATKKV
ncbi:hypothetical protein [Streptomyces clavuligerus]|uniref:Uncharacterized protein n=1 Tax=Streptomyces clavuligerus TaxID=1901 RepID=E2Q3Z9_STRCL|nr:Hypothetical protein SCLAV_3865 [Streptomyces clavuligerus]